MKKILYLLCGLTFALAFTCCSTDNEDPGTPDPGTIDATKLIGRWKSVEGLVYTGNQWISEPNDLFVVEFFDDVLHWYDKDPEMSNSPSICPYEIEGKILKFTVRHDPDLPSVASYTIEELTDTRLKLCRYEIGDEHGFVFTRVSK
ncbi:MAG TPA: hypothetical protein H9828_06115 [Candidatus Alistipes intestinigallinarum]|uniref:Lipocalin-like domain-containing protein n=1 Tax=Candidatus Alistipes intestinigallinarum TaxID=2838440 RepID=A0A9D2CC39_9BACT|nr:hypothetical protein [Candidatus Alistipes intestinigallinarum]